VVVVVMMAGSRVASIILLICIRSLLHVRYPSDILPQLSATDDSKLAGSNLDVNLDDGWYKDGQGLRFLV